MKVYLSMYDLLLRPSAQGLKGVDLVDADVVAPIDDTNHQQIPHKNIKA